MRAGPWTQQPRETTTASAPALRHHSSPETGPAQTLPGTPAERPAPRLRNRAPRACEPTPRHRIPAWIPELPRRTPKSPPIFPLKTPCLDRKHPTFGDRRSPCRRLQSPDTRHRTPAARRAAIAGSARHLSPPRRGGGGTKRRGGRLLQGPRPRRPPSPVPAPPALPLEDPLPLYTRPSPGSPTAPLHPPTCLGPWARLGKVTRAPATSRWTTRSCRKRGEKAEAQASAAGWLHKHSGREGKRRPAPGPARPRLPPRPLVRVTGWARSRPHPGAWRRSRATRRQGLAACSISGQLSWSAAALATTLPS